MIGTRHLQLFEKYRDAPGHAFSAGVVTEADKDLYWELYQWLVESVRNVSEQFDHFDVFASRLSRDGGVQGQRPKDIWASVININSEGFGKYPQVFAIANENGIEIGLSLAIHERDYFNADVKMRARAMIPSLYRKLPDAGSELVSNIDSLIDWSVWKSVIRHREASELNFRNVADLIEHHSSNQVNLRGGGTVYKVVPITIVSAEGFDLEKELLDAVGVFEPLMLSLSPSGADNNFVHSQIELEVEGQSVKPFSPQAEDDGKTYKLRKLAERLGQPKFRNQLIEAYGGVCAISGTQEPTSLQAAHIVPYDGKKSNKITNGILLRADIHNLFDRGLIYICPDTLRVEFSPTIKCSTYRTLDGSTAKLPSNSQNAPLRKNLVIQKEKYLLIHKC